MDDLRSLLNERFHATLMTIPLLGVLFFTILPLLYMISIAFTNYDHNHLPPKTFYLGWIGKSRQCNHWAIWLQRSFQYLAGP